MPIFQIDRDRLLAIFRHAALVAGPVASIGLAGCGPCPPVDEIFLLSNPDAPTQALIDACRDPVHPDCRPLCVQTTGMPNQVFGHCEMHQDRDGYFVVHAGWEPVCPGGRRPQRLAFRAPRAARSRTGAWFAGLFQLEAASVSAFQTLHDELTREGAPRVLRHAAAAAARDEVRHARLTAALARRYGGRPRPPRVAPTPPRSLAAVAEENVTEGCVREAYGALVATVQSRASDDPIVRAVMARIARDETTHAALAVAVDRWAVARLPPNTRPRLAAAREAAIAELEAGVDVGWTPELGAVAGLPDPATARRLLAQLRKSLWV
jgi:hypothetical protein